MKKVVAIPSQHPTSPPVNATYVVTDPANPALLQPFNTGVLSASEVLGRIPFDVCYLPNSEACVFGPWQMQRETATIPGWELYAQVVDDSHQQSWPLNGPLPYTFTSPSNDSTSGDHATTSTPRRPPPLNFSNLETSSPTESPTQPTQGAVQMATQPENKAALSPSRHSPSRIVVRKGNVEIRFETSPPTNTIVFSPSGYIRHTPRLVVRGYGTFVDPSAQESSQFWQETAPQNDVLAKPFSFAFTTRANATKDFRLKLTQLPSQFRALGLVDPLVTVVKFYAPSLVSEGEPDPQSPRSLMGQHVHPKFSHLRRLFPQAKLERV